MRRRILGLPPRRARLGFLHSGGKIEYLGENSTTPGGIAPAANSNSPPRRYAARCCYWQTPAIQVWPVAQLWPQAPQFEVPVLVFTQLSPQRFCVARQVAVQALA